MRRPLLCTGGACQDSLRVKLGREATGNGYTRGGIFGIWTGQGSCLGREGACTAVPSASWSASFSANRIAEPTGRGLMGLGPLALAVVTRRQGWGSAITREASG